MLKFVVVLYRRADLSQEQFYDRTLRRHRPCGSPRPSTVARLAAIALAVVA